MPSVPPLLRDPLLERDYVRLCTRPAFFRNRALAPALLGTILLFMYGVRDEFSSLDTMGRSVHLVFTWLAAFLTAATAAAETAVAVPTERSTGSLTVLLTVPRTPLRLAAGFYLSRVLVALTALLAVLPLEGLALLLGGVALHDMAVSLLCILGATIAGAAAGLLAGYDATNHRLAIGRAGLLALAVTVLVPVVLGALALAFHDFDPRARSPEPDPLSPTRPEDWLLLSGIVWFFLTPAGGLVVHTAEVSRVGLFAGLPPAVTPGRIHLLVACLCVASALVAVLVTGRRLGADTERATVASRREGPWRRFLAFLRARRPRAAAEVWEEPLLWKESRPPRNPWARAGLHLAVAAYAVLLLFLWTSAPVQESVVGRRQQETALFDVLCAAPVWLFLLANAAACGTLLAEERERNALDLLRAAPFRARAFFLARFAGTGWRLLPMAAATLPFVLLGTWKGIVHPLGVLAWVLGAALVSPFLALLAFHRGMAAGTVRAAQRRAGTALGVFVVGWPLLHWILEEALNARDRTHQVLFSANPLVAVTGPYLLFARAAYEPDPDLLRMGLVGTAAALFWAGVAGFLWWRLPRALDRALHGDEER